MLRKEINELLNKYCSFLPVEIAGKEKEWKDGKEVVLDKDRIINDVTPWTRKPVDLKDEDYKAFTKNYTPWRKSPCSGYT